jgi:hypothetical protein
MLSLRGALARSALLMVMGLFRGFREFCKMIAADRKGIEVPQHSAETDRLPVGDDRNDLLA